MTCLDPTDRLLVSAAAGDMGAFAALYDATSVVAYRLAQCMDPDDAERLLQETFVEAWRRSSTFDHTRDRALSWVLVIMRECWSRSRSRAVA